MSKSNIGTLSIDDGYVSLLIQIYSKRSLKFNSMKLCDSRKISQIQRNYHRHKLAAAAEVVVVAVEAEEVEEVRSAEEGEVRLVAEEEVPLVEAVEVPLAEEVGVPLVEEEEVRSVVAKEDLLAAGVVAQSVVAVEELVPGTVRPPLRIDLDNNTETKRNRVLCSVFSLTNKATVYRRIWISIHFRESKLL